MMRSRKTLRPVCLTSLLALGQAAIAQDWPRFRGPDGSGVSESRNLPTEFGPDKNVVWKVAAPPGLSSPIVLGDRVFFTSYEREDRTIHCVDAQSGKMLWNRTVQKLRDEIATPPSGPATPTPASDGKSIVVLFPDVGLFCYTASGTERWKVDLPPFHSMHGISSSVVLVDDKVILLVDQLEDSFIAAYRLESGEICWKVDRPSGLIGGYSTPTIFEPPNGAAQIIVAGPMELVAFNADDGNRVWWVTGVTNAPVSVPVVCGKRVFICEPVGEPIPLRVLGDVVKDDKVLVQDVKEHIGTYRMLERIDRNWGNHDGVVEEAEWNRAFGSFVNRGGLAAVDLGGAGDVTETHVQWTYRRAVPYIPSVLVYDGVLYFVRDGGILTTVDPSSGDVLRTDRLSNAIGEYYASPIAADGKLFLVNTSGRMSVITAGKDWEVLASNDLGEDCHATPAISNGRIYVRTRGSLFCFGTDGE